MRSKIQTTHLRSRRSTLHTKTQTQRSRRSTLYKDPDGLLCTKIQTVYFAFGSPGIRVSRVDECGRGTKIPDENSRKPQTRKPQKTPRKPQTVYQRKLQTRHSMPLTSPSAHLP